VLVSDPSIDLLQRWRDGDPQAASDLFHLYGERLMALARSRISEKLARRLDPEDVVQSACRSFFGGARDGRYYPQHDADLWSLLVAITLNKLHLQVRRNQAAKRAPEREQREGHVADTDSESTDFVAREPTPLEAVALADEVEQVMRRLGPLEQRMLEMRLQGYNLDEIGAATGRTERTVRRTLEQVKTLLRQQGAGLGD
jgi:RNA polymerase sigma factor (sigma-70 family)